MSRGRTNLLHSGPHQWAGATYPSPHPSQPSSYFIPMPSLLSAREAEETCYFWRNEHGTTFCLIPLYL